MQPRLHHPWPEDEAAALALQRQLAGQVERHDRLDDIRLVAGLDVAYDEHSDRLVAAAVVLDAHTLVVVEQAVAVDVARFPYIPGLFSFRELPPLVQALGRLSLRPDLIVCDGQGIAHPRRFGLACHVGLLFDVPSIGCGKTRLLGQHDQAGPERGDSTPLRDGDDIIGSALRTQRGIKPVYVSTGHRIALPTACHWITRLCSKYRLPETTRMADQLVRREMAAGLGGRKED
ncbi:Endonuclease V [Andreprevotia lacus DSM 23236]|jgi:deoxyribonuclease V|uniref:Endonuclease V n=1 Tax=Andreprevotia lacus DSM 23236 TaxID=1121001 RepID=A0A1W1X8D5_9NEIS|nr:deoxyribonuclease V [Andreprevotia lacus]SMC20179.1 Endonuclease V [Andreprevotia lacus DSM 23236]